MNTSVELAKIPVSCTRTIEFVSPEDIIRIEGMQNYSKVYVRGGREILSNNNIGFFKSNLLRYNFLICHKSHVINPNFIIRYYKEGYIEMEDGEKVPLARRRKKEFVDIVLQKHNVATDNLIV